MALANFTNLDEAQLKAEEAKAGEQIFRLRFQQSLGQTDGLKKLRALKKDVARIKTLQRQRTLGIAQAPAEGAAPAKAKKTATKKTAAPKAAKKAAAKKAE